MRTFFNLLAMLIITSCQTTSRTLTIEQCSPFMAMVPVEVVTDHGGTETRNMIDPDRSACNCRQYFYGKNKIGPISGVTRKPLIYCHQMMGNPPKDYAQLATFLESVRQDIASESKKKGER